MLDPIWPSCVLTFRIVSLEHFCINSGFFSSADISAFRPLILVLIGVSTCALIVSCTPSKSVSTIFFESADSFSFGKFSQAIAALGTKVDTVIDSTAKLIRRSDHILSILEGRDYKAYIDQTGNTIHFKIQDSTVETITANDLNRLG